MTLLRNSNIRTVAHTGNLTLPANPQRSYFMIKMNTGETAQLEFGNGGGQLDIEAGSFYEPLVTPNGEITVTAVGSYVIVSND